MSNDKKEKSKVSLAFSGFRGTLFITLIIALAFALLIYVMYIFDFVAFVDFGEIFGENSKKNETLPKSELLFENINEINSDSYSLLYELTIDELTLILSEAVPSHSYKATSVVTNYSEDNVNEVTIVANKNMSKYEISKYNDDLIFESITSDGTTVTVKDELRNRSAKYPYDEKFSFESMCQIPDTYSVIEICNSIKDESTPVINYNLSLVNVDNQNLYKAEFVYPDLLQREEYLINIDNNMIVSLNSYFDDELYYSYSLLSYEEIKD